MLYTISGNKTIIYSPKLLSGFVFPADFKNILIINKEIALFRNE